MTYLGQNTQSGDIVRRSGLQSQTMNVAVVTTTVVTVDGKTPVLYNV